MAARVVDPNKFLLLGAVTDWVAVSRRHVAHAPSPKDLMRERKLGLARLVQLRWLTAPQIGYPTEPFQVWRRPAMPMEAEHAVAFTSMTLLGVRVIAFDRPRVFVRAGIQAGAGGSVIAFSGVPFGSLIVGTQTLAAGFNSVTFSGPAIQCLVLSSGATLQSLTGLDALAQNDPRWELVEIVGLPVGPAWHGLHELDAKQGLIASLGDPRAAALDRFRRGAPFYGWDEQLTATLAAPPWLLADPHAMLKVMDDSVLEPLRQMIVHNAPQAHTDFTVNHTLPLIGGGDPAVTVFKPLHTLLFGAGTDPLASLVTGYGTAFEDIDIPTITLGDRQLFNDPGRSDWDFMVTAHYENGLDGQSAAIEYAAMVFAPAVAVAPPVPSNLGATSDGLRSPQTTDADWRGVVRVSWDKVADNLPFRVGSYAFARARLAPAGGVEPLMDPRPYDKALQPISATVSPEQEQTGKLLALDERYTIAGAPNPNGLLYGLAHQDLFGLWSGWATAPFTIGEPPVRPVDILSVRLDPTATPSGPCPAVLTIEYAWDWAPRSPERIEFVGRLYAQTKLGDPPANLTVPTGLQTSLAGGAGFVLKVLHGGAAAAAPDTGTPAVAATMQYLALDGKTLVAIPPTPIGPRRYRITLTGFSLDFNAASRIGLGLWARALEHRAPQRTGDWSARPSVASTADPRPPVITVEHENVLLASMADAAGLHHARLEWPAAASAAGYFVYTTTEEKLRADRGLPSAPKALTLSQRLAALRDAFQANPSRRSFTRVNAQPVAATAMSVTLPRGSKEIHLYVVLGVSAGQVESAWPAPGDPGLRKRPIAYAAPQVVLPAPPDLEVSRVLDDSVAPAAYRAQVKVRSKPGAAVTRIDLHRVRVPEAALTIDTMGPPIATLVGSTADYTVTPTTSTEPGVAQTLGTIRGRDAVQGSWKRVFYRAVAWTGNDPTHGIFGGRSPASALREVIVPPAVPPDLSPLAGHWPGGPLGDVQVDATTLAPVLETPLGPHRLRVDALVEKPDGTTAPLFTHPSTPGEGDRLDALGTVPPAPGAHGIWRQPGAVSGQTALHMLLRRASVDDRLRVRVLLTDPLGRATEAVLEVPPGSPLPAPDILLPKVTKVPSKGFLLSFQTSVPVPPTSAGPYVLSVSYAPTIPPLFPQPGPLLLRPLALQVQQALPDIAIAQPGENLFTDPATIPLRRAPAPLRRTQLGMALRGSGGNLLVTLTSPDGRTAKLTRKLS